MNKPTSPFDFKTPDLLDQGFFPKSKHSYRTNHIQKALKEFLQQSMPLDAFMSGYFRKHKAIGSKDRLEIGDLVYEFMRSFGTVKYGEDTDSQALPEHDKLSLPKDLYEELQTFWTPEQIQTFAQDSNSRAPTVICVNTLKITREALLGKLKQRGIEAQATSTSPTGIHILGRYPLVFTQEFKQGLFFIQDENSQIVAQTVEALPGDQVLDFCAGAGGKSLSIALTLKNKGQIHLHDVRTSALHEAKQRLQRLGIHNFKLGLGHAHSFDWVLVDAPCTGTGTYRRNPDLKWRYSKAMLNEVCQTQTQILEEAYEYLKKTPTSRLVYATCSVLQKENKDQVTLFAERKNLSIIKEKSFNPTPGGGDGFYVCVLGRSSRLGF